MSQLGHRVVLSSDRPLQVYPLQRTSAQSSFFVVPQLEWATANVKLCHLRNWLRTPISAGWAATERDDGGCRMLFLRLLVGRLGKTDVLIGQA
jgi:hypothetical protein